LIQNPEFDQIENGRNFTHENGETLHVHIVLEVLCDNEHSLMCPTDRGNDSTVDHDETERVDRERGRDRNGAFHIVTSGPRWYRTHAERGRRETDMD
jgi:hypothetical protein